MDELMKELVAMGAAAAANCHPCMDQHLAMCDKLGISREEVAVFLGINSAMPDKRSSTMPLQVSATGHICMGPAPALFLVTSLWLSSIA
jgi:AhpD family alkylhydroperoxidase